MRKQIVVWGLALGLIVAMSAYGGAEQWAIKADSAESCSCNLPCPCHFGSPPTHSYCKATGLIEIKKGYYGDVRLYLPSFLRFQAPRGIQSLQLHAVHRRLPEKKRDDRSRPLLQLRLSLGRRPLSQRPTELERQLRKQKRAERRDAPLGNGGNA